MKQYPTKRSRHVVHNNIYIYKHIIEQVTYLVVIDHLNANERQQLQSPKLNLLMMSISKKQQLLATQKERDDDIAEGIQEAGTLDHHAGPELCLSIADKPPRIFALEDQMRPDAAETWAARSPP